MVGDLDGSLPLAPFWPITAIEPPRRSARRESAVGDGLC